MNVNLRSLIAKLNPQARSAVEAAAGLCLGRTHYDVEIEHFLLKLLDIPDGDLLFILKHYGIDRSRLAKDLTASLDRLKSGNARTPSLSPSLVRMLTQAWTIGSVEYGAAQIRTGHGILALALDEELGRLVRSTSKELEKISAEDLRKNFDTITAESAEEAGAAYAPAAGDAAGGGARPGSGKQPNLEQYTVDMTAKARDGKLDPVLGRDFEVRQVVDILTRRRQNNPILVGEAGVGKTAIVEGFAMRIVSGEVPPALRNVTLRTLDLALLQAGAGVKGEFENRLKGLIEEVRSSPTPIILFIDEAHTMIGAGGSAGQGDAANLLKPALARGELRTIAATTWSEYKKYFEKDPALTRRFQVVQVEEPSEDKAILMVRGVASILEKHHRVQVLDEALEAAVRLSHRYIPARQLPDKAVSLLDTTCARVAISQHAVPAQLEDCRRTIEALRIELEIIGREEAVGIDATDRRTDADARLATSDQRREELERQWQSERELVDRILAIRGRLRHGSEPVEGTGSKLEQAAQVQRVSGDVPAPEQLGADERRALLEELKLLQGRLSELQGESPLILPSVDEQAVASVVQDWTGVPVGRMVKNEIEAVLKLADTLNQRVIGQRHALEMIASRIQTSRAKLDNPSKPIGVFMLCGPSGVGKTETALTLAEALYGGEQNVITINMSEFQEAHTVSTLKGSPPGYVGYGEGGVLTEAVRRRPYSVVLLDEVEKAHSDVHELFFQVFDKGWMEDGEGRRIDFKNTIILLTSNVGTDLIVSLCKDPELMPGPEGIAKALRDPLLKVFPAALLGRLVTIPYYPLSDVILANIVRLQLARISKRVTEHHGIPFSYDDEAVKLIVSRCTEVESGGRMIDAILTNTVLPAISREFLVRTMAGQPLNGVQLGVANGDFDYRFD